MKNTLKPLMSSDSVEWETPQDLFDELNRELNFQLDVGATSENCKGRPFFSKVTDGLVHDWRIASDNNWCWMNPPYGRGIGNWVKNASEERTVVALLPARTDTKYSHNYIYNKPNTEIRFVKGRLRFSNSKNSAPFPSMIVIFR